jgi:hypothetical protein
MQVIVEAYIHCLDIVALQEVPEVYIGIIDVIELGGSLQFRHIDIADSNDLGFLNFLITLQVVLANLPDTNDTNADFRVHSDILLGIE